MLSVIFFEMFGGHNLKGFELQLHPPPPSLPNPYGLNRVAIAQYNNSSL